MTVGPVLWLCNSVVVVELLSHVWLFETPWTAACQVSLSFTISQSLLKFMSIESMMLSNHLWLDRYLTSPLLPSSPFALSLSQHQGLFQWVSSSHQVAKVLELQLQHHSFQWIFRADFLQDWVVWSCSPRDSQESSPTPQFKSINSSVLAFFIVQLSHPYMTTGKTKTLTKWTFVGKVMSLFFNMLSRFVIAFLPRSKCLFISWLQSPPAVILEPPQNKVCHCFYCLPIYFPWSDGTRCHDLSFPNVEFHQEAL